MKKSYQELEQERNDLQKRLSNTHYCLQKASRELYDHGLDPWPWRENGEEKDPLFKSWKILKEDTNIIKKTFIKELPFIISSILFLGTNAFVSAWYGFLLSMIFSMGFLVFYYAFFYKNK